MTNATGDVRVRRPNQHEALIIELRDDAAFSTIRDTLLFAAAVGVRMARRVAFTAVGGDPIRYETLTGPTFSDALISMLAAKEAPDDPEILDSSRLEERVRIFEEFANGGLEYVQEQVNIRHQPASQVVIALATEALAEDAGAEPASIDELLGGVTW